ncbi:aminotransferase class I/II-fold pyridoxal phosphate-dependent enzyme, partial [Pseudomonas aeruginosa]
SLSSGKAVHYLCDESSDWFPDLDDIRAKITPRTRGIVIINPNNPTGAVYSKELLMEIVEIARQHNLIIFADEIYDKILYDDAEHHSIAPLAPD